MRKRGFVSRRAKEERRARAKRKRGGKEGLFRAGLRRKGGAKRKRGGKEEKRVSHRAKEVYFFRTEQRRKGGLREKENIFYSST